MNDIQQRLPVGALNGEDCSPARNTLDQLERRVVVEDVQRQAAFSGHLQWRLRGNEQAQLRQRIDHIAQRRSGSEQMLQVVENQQDLTAPAQPLDERFKRRSRDIVLAADR